MNIIRKAIAQDIEQIEELKKLNQEFKESDSSVPDERPAYIKTKNGVIIKNNDNYPDECEPVDLIELIQIFHDILNNYGNLPVFIDDKELSNLTVPLNKYNISINEVPGDSVSSKYKLVLGYFDKDLQDFDAAICSGNIKFRLKNVTNNEENK